MSALGWELGLPCWAGMVICTGTSLAIKDFSGFNGNNMGNEILSNRLLVAPIGI